MTADGTPAPGGGVRDLGAIDGPILCFGGPYSNLQATDAVLAEARARGFPPERVICTGDVVAYCADPKATVDLVRAAGIQVVMGNCEESLAFDAADCGCGFSDGSECWELSKVWYAHAQAALDAEARAWMGGLPRQLRLELGGHRLAVIHGGDLDISAYIFASTPAPEKARILDRLARPGAVSGVIAGHSGLPFTDIVDGRLWHNAGAVGMPANDGTPRGWFSILAPAPGGIEITLHALDYDHQAAARAFAAQPTGLPYAQSLVDGLWPNMAVLPEPERRLSGRPLDPGPVHWPGEHATAAE